MARYFFKMNGLKCADIKELENQFNLEEYTKQGFLIASRNKKKVADELDNYPFPQNEDDVDLTKVMKEWFPFGEYDIFLSHSHSDEKKAIAISYYLAKEFNLRCFVDSCVWGYSEILLRKLDEKYSEHNDYDHRNGTTAHVHLMLNSALMKMMYSCTTFIFLQTNNSLQTNRKGVKNWTYSSWIYSELCMSRVMSDILYSIKGSESSKPNRILLEAARLPMGYSDVTTSHLKDITLEDLQINFSWQKQFKDSSRDGIFKNLYDKKNGFIYDCGYNAMQMKPFER